MHVEPKIIYIANKYESLYKYAIVMNMRVYQAYNLRKTSESQTVIETVSCDCR